MKKGIFIGRTTLDIVYYHQGMPGENEKSKTWDYRSAVGGNACNGAVTYALLGGRAVLITAIGSSNIGRSMKLELEQYQIELIDLLEGKNVLPFISAILINMENESRTIWGGQQSMMEYAGIDQEDIIRNGAFIMADDQFPTLAAELFYQAREEQIPAVFDAERWRPETEKLLDGATDVIASSDCRPADQRSMFEVLREKKIPYRAVTDGGNPILWETEERSGSVLPIKVKPVDTLGAGDILHGAYCYFRFAQGLSFEQALDKASRVSGYSVAYRGPRQGIYEYMAGTKVETESKSLKEEDGT